jgi:hypothetical protein
MMYQYLIQHVAEAHQDDMRQRAARTRRVRQARAAFRQAKSQAGGAAPRRAEHGLTPQPQL